MAIFLTDQATMPVCLLDHKSNMDTVFGKSPVAEWAISVGDSGERTLDVEALADTTP